MTKEDNILLGIGGSVLLVAIFSIAAWCWQFGQQGLSASTSDWAAFGSFVGGVVGPIFSLLTIIYLFWSFKAQIRCEFEKSERERRINEIQAERERRLAELRVLVDKFNRLCRADIDFAEIAGKYLPCYFGKTVDYRMVDRHTVEIGDVRLYGGMVEVLRGLYERVDLKDFIKFFDDCVRTTFHSNLVNAQYTMVLIVDQATKLLELDTGVDVIKSLVLPCFADGAALHQWGRLPDKTWFLLQVIRDLPNEKESWGDVLPHYFINEFVGAQSEIYAADQLVLKVGKDGQSHDVSEYIIIDTLNKEYWVRGVGGEWNRRE